MRNELRIFLIKDLWEVILGKCHVHDAYANIQLTYCFVVLWRVQHNNEGYNISHLVWLKKSILYIKIEIAIWKCPKIGEACNISRLFAWGQCLSLKKQWMRENNTHNNLAWWEVAREIAAQKRNVDCTSQAFQPIMQMIVILMKLFVVIIIGHMWIMIPVTILPRSKCVTNIRISYD